jgi:alkaline phosphatase D
MFLLVLLAGAGEKAPGNAKVDRQASPSLIAFGSCADENAAQPFWWTILGQEPDLMLMLGDNVYADTTDIGVMEAAYRKLGDKPGFRLFRKQVPVLATWDDHDYGRNNAGRHYPMKEQSERAFLSFFNEPEASPRWERPGVYGAWRFGSGQQRLQVILLDTRYFRDDPPSKQQRDTTPDEGDPKTILGKAQWEWLEKQLQKPAEIRLIGSSIQVVADQHGSEKWGNFPREHERLYALIEESGAEGIIFVSGDRHHMEVSRNDEVGPYPIYDFTSSGLTQGAGGGIKQEPNRHRLGSCFTAHNFGLIRIDWAADPTSITLQGRSVTGRVLFEHQIRRSNISR